MLTCEQVLTEAAFLLPAPDTFMLLERARRLELE